MSRRQIGSEENHHVRTFPNQKAAQDDRSAAKLRHAKECCPCPLEGGGACGECISCQLIFECNHQEDGLVDDWCQYFRDKECVRLRRVDLFYSYNPALPFLVPPVVGAIFIAGVSQAVIYHPAVASASLLFPNQATITIVTLDVIGDMPVAASLAAGEFVVYFPYGTGVVATTPDGTTWGLDRVNSANVAAYSISYPTLADVPHYLINSNWKVQGTNAAGDKVLVDLSVKMYFPGWLIEVGAFMDSTTLLVADATPTVLRITHINAALGFWELERTLMLTLMLVRRNYLNAIYPWYDSCNICLNNRARGCGGNRCGVVNKRAVFGRSHGVDLSALRRPDEFARYTSEVKMLENVLFKNSTAYYGTTIHHRTMRVIDSVAGDNLSFVPKKVLRHALKHAKKAATEIEALDYTDLTNGEVTRYIPMIAAEQRLAWKTTQANMRATRAATAAAAISAATTPAVAATPKATPLTQRRTRTPFTNNKPAQGSVYDGNMWQ